jgi:hypothetical protein
MMKADSTHAGGGEKSVRHARTTTSPRSPYPVELKSLQMQAEGTATGPADHPPADRGPIEPFARICVPVGQREPVRLTPEQLGDVETTVDETLCNKSLNLSYSGTEL